MTETQMIETCIEIIKERTGFEPEIGMILGSGLGDYADQIENPFIIPYSELPEFPVSTVAGHAGQFVMGIHKGKKVIVMQGRVHYYEGDTQRRITLPIRIMKGLGVKKILLTNAAGGVNRNFKPGTLMMIRDHINFSGSNPLIGPNMEQDGPKIPGCEPCVSGCLPGKIERRSRKNRYSSGRRHLYDVLRSML